MIMQTTKITFSQVFPNYESNVLLKRMFEIYYDRKYVHPLKKIPFKERTQSYIYCEWHHFIPRKWYKLNNLEIDDSDYNRVLVSGREHLELHVILRDYFKSVNNIAMYNAMAQAIYIMCGKNRILMKSLKHTNELDFQYALLVFEENRQAFSEAQANITPYKRSNETKKKLSQSLKQAFSQMSPTARNEKAKKQSASLKESYASGRVIHPRLLSPEEQIRRENERQQKKIERQRLRKLKLEKQKEQTKLRNEEKKRKRQLDIQQRNVDRLARGYTTGYAEFYANASSEWKANFRQTLHNAATNRSDEKKKQISCMRSEQARKYWDNISNEDLNKYRECRKTSTIQQWANMTQEQHDEQCRRVSDGLNRFWKTEESLAVRKSISTKAKARFANMSEEERNNSTKRMTKQNIGRKWMHNSQTGEEKFVSPSEFDTFYANGFTDGRVFHSRTKRKK